MKLWYVCEALARQKLGLSEEYTLFAADINRPKRDSQVGVWTSVTVGIGEKVGELWTDKHEGIHLYRHEIETYPGYEA